MITTKEREAIRTELLRRESEVRSQIKALNEYRRSLPLEEVQDYPVHCARDGHASTLSKMFLDKDDLILIHNMGSKCPGCTMWADGFNGLHPHIMDRASFFVVSNDPWEVQKKFMDSRGWTFPMASVAGTTLFEDLGFAGEDTPYGKYHPGVSAFVKKDGKVYRRAWATICPGDEFNGGVQLIDLVGEGSDDWFPKFKYGEK